MGLGRTPNCCIRDHCVKARKRAEDFSGAAGLRHKKLRGLKGEQKRSSQDSGRTAAVSLNPSLEFVKARSRIIVGRSIKPRQIGVAGSRMGRALLG